MAITKLSALGLGTGVGGKVLQVVSTTKIDTFAYSSTTYTDVTGLSVSITPSSTSNKILIVCNISIQPGKTSIASMWRLLRGSTEIAVPTSGTYIGTGGSYFDGGSQEYTVNGYGVNYLDSPSTTSATTYKIQVRTTGSPTTDLYINRRQSDDLFKTTSSITAFEILV